MSLRERFDAKYEKQESGCWEWTASKRNGYGQLFVSEGIISGAHRVSYELHVGPIPEGLQIDHLCRNRVCVNPAHLEAVTQRENLLRGDTIPARNAKKTHCSRGHEYPDDVKRDRLGRRVCAGCNREYLRARKVRLRAEAVA